MNINNQFENARLPLLMAVISVISMIIGMRLQDSLADDGIIQDDQQSSHKAIYQASEHIQSKYYGSMPDDGYVDAVISEMINQLDPYSHYFPKAQNSLYDTYIKGVGQGIGIDIALSKDSAYIYDIIDGSTADESFIERGDILLSINGLPINESNMDTLSVMTNGDLNEVVELEIYDQQEGLSRTIELTIEEISYPLIEDFIIQKDGYQKTISYVKIRRFYNSVYRDFMEIMEKHKNTLAEDVTYLILDLRDNPGGVVEETVKILNQLFAEKDVPILSTKSRINKAHEYISNGRSFLTIERIVILCNNSSASASEILAGSLQDHDKAVLIGEDTYGKGLIQQNYDLSNDASINLSIGEYILPTGRSIYLPTTEDTTYYTITNKRPLSVQKGVKVDIDMTTCFTEKKLLEQLKNIVVEHKLWSSTTEIDTLLQKMQSYDPLTLIDSCSSERREYLSWLYTVRYMQHGALINVDMIDPMMKKAVEVISAEEYSSTLGY